MIANPKYARALLAKQASRMRETVKEVMKHEKCEIMHHRLYEIVYELGWIERVYGGEK